MQPAGFKSYTANCLRKMYSPPKPNSSGQVVVDLTDEPEPSPKQLMIKLYIPPGDQSKTSEFTPSANIKSEPSSTGIASQVDSETPVRRSTRPTRPIPAIAHNNALTNFKKPTKKKRRPRAASPTRRAQQQTSAPEPNRIDSLSPQSNPQGKAPFC